MNKDKNKFKRADVQLPIRTLSHATMNLKRKNKRIIKDYLEEQSIDKLIAKSRDEKAEEIAFLLLDDLSDDHISDITGVSKQVIYQMRKDRGLSF